MMTKTKKVVLLSSAAVLVVLLIGAASVHLVRARSRSCMGRPMRQLLVGKGARLHSLRSELDLTAEQRDQLMKIHETHKDRIGGVVAKLMAARRELRDAVLLESPDEEAIRKAAVELGTLIGDASALAVDLVAEARDVLTPEQIELIRRAIADGDKIEKDWLSQTYAK